MKEGAPADAGERMEYQHLHVTRQGRVLVVVLNREEKFNALNLDLMMELEDLALSLQGDQEARAVILTGAGRHFSAGADLEEVKKRSQNKATVLARRNLNRIGGRLIRALFEIDQITIGAVNGGALGGGACIASALDFRIGTPQTFIGYPEIHLGMNLSWGGLPLCVQLIGAARAKRMVILGERESARTLLDWGFLDEVVEPERLLARAIEVAEAYAARPPLQAQMIKRSVNMISSAMNASIMHMDSEQYLLAASTEDHAEGVRAFFEKRKPQFKGN